MQFALQREVPIPDNNLFTATEFIDWEKNDLSITFFWGNDTLRQYNKIIFYSLCKEFYKDACAIIKTDTDSQDDLNNLMNDLMSMFAKAVENKNNIAHLEVRTSAIQTDNIQNYNDLFRHLWKQNLETIWDYCPRNNFNLIIEWHNVFLERDLKMFGEKGHLVYNEDDDKNFHRSFVGERLFSVNNEIEKSREWYQKTYEANEKDGNKLTKYPIKELKKYAEWLENQIKNDIDKLSDPTTKATAPIEREINVEETKIKQLAAWLEKYGIWNMPPTNNFTSDQQARFYKKISDYKTPKLIAMLSHIGFIDHFLNNYNNDKADLYRKLGAALNVDARTVKGNILVLNSQTEENKTRYTSHKFVEEVANDFNEIVQN